MNQKLIQSYVDNQLSEVDRTNFEQALSESPALQREVESYKAFKAAIRSASLTEPIPNLQPVLANIARPKRAAWIAKFAPALIAGVAIFGIGIAANRVVQDRTNPTVVSAKTLPAEGHLETKSARIMRWDGSSPEEGADRIRETFYRSIPTISLDNLPGAKFTAAECGSCWISFHYTYKSQEYAIYGRCETGSLDSGIKKSINGTPIFVFSDAVGWYDKDDMTYTCLGGTPDGRIAVATEAMKRTSKLD